MKNKGISNGLNTVAVFLLLTASVIYHLFQAVSEKENKAYLFSKGIRFSGAACGQTVTPAFPLLLLPAQILCHHKPN